MFTVMAASFRAFPSTKCNIVTYAIATTKSARQLHYHPDLSTINLDPTIDMSNGLSNFGK